MYKTSEQFCEINFDQHMIFSVQGDSAQRSSWITIKLVMLMDSLFFGVRFFQNIFLIVFVRTQITFCI